LLSNKFARLNSRRTQATEIRAIALRKSNAFAWTNHKTPAAVRQVRMLKKASSQRKDLSPMGAREVIDRVSRSATAGMAGRI